MVGVVVVFIGMLAGCTLGSLLRVLFHVRFLPERLAQYVQGALQFMALGGILMFLLTFVALATNQPTNYTLALATTGIFMMMLPVSYLVVIDAWKSLRRNI